MRDLASAISCLSDLLASWSRFLDLDLGLDPLWLVPPEGGTLEEVDELAEGWLRPRMPTDDEADADEAVGTVC